MDVCPFEDWLIDDWFVLIVFELGWGTDDAAC